MPVGVRFAVAVVPLAIAGVVVAAQPAASSTYQLASPVAYHAGAAPGGVAVADLNGDGHLDVAVTLGDQDAVGVLLGRGDGTFGAVTTYPTGGQGPIAVAVGDVNGDGLPDLVVANAQGSEGGGTIGVLLGRASGGFAPVVTYSTVSTGADGSNPLALELVDVDGDGNLDVLTADGTSGDLSYLHGNGDGTFGAATTVATGAGADAIASATSGGDQYVAVADSGKTVQSGVDPTSTGTVSVFRVTPPLLPVGAPTFTQVSTVGVGAQPAALAFTDVNGDGEPDLVTANGGSDDVSVADGEGGGTFAAAVQHPVGRLPVGLAVTDVDGDGHPDLLVLSESANAVSVLSGPAFTARRDVPTGRTPLGIATGDLDGDGRPDVVTSSFSDSTVDVLLQRPAADPARAAVPPTTSPATAAAALSSPQPVPVRSAGPGAAAAQAPAAPSPASTPAAPPTSLASAPPSRPAPQGPSAQPGRHPTTARARTHQGAAPPRSAARAYEDQLASPTHTTAAALARDGLLALLVLALFQLPTTLVNETLKDNAAVIATWFGRTRRIGARAATLVQQDRLSLAAGVVAYAAVASVVYAFVEPSFRFDLSSLALVVGLLAALVVTTVSKIAPMALSLRHEGIAVGPRLFPAYLVLAAGCVATSRLTGLHPGIVVGAVIGLAAGNGADRRLQGRAMAWAAGTVLTVTLAAWFARGTLVSAVGPADSFRSAVVGVALTTVVVAGVELLSVGMLPLRFFAGSQLLTWSRAAWAFFALVGAFLFVHVLVRPGAEDGGPTIRVWPLVAFFLAYLVIAFGFWAWFRVHDAEQAPAAPAERPSPQLPPATPSTPAPRPRPSPTARRGAPAAARDEVRETVSTG